jgi:hypothetical protein
MIKPFENFEGKVLSLFVNHVCVTIGYKLLHSNSCQTAKNEININYSHFLILIQLLLYYK